MDTRNSFNLNFDSYTNVELLLFVHHLSRMGFDFRLKAWI